MRPLMPKTIAFTSTITEAELRQRLVEEVLDNMGALNADGSTPEGITSKVSRGDSHKGGYIVEIIAPMAPRLLLGQGGGNG